MNRVITLFILFCTCVIIPQQDAIRNNSFYFPHTISNGSITHSISIITAKLPEDVIESDDLFRAPLALYQIKMGYLKNFTVNGSIETNYAANQILLGTQFNYELNHFGFSVGVDGSFWFGHLDVSGFKTTTHGFNVYPNVNIGYTFPNFSVTFRSELLYILKQTTTNGEATSENYYKTFSGYSFAFYIEQPLWDKHFVILGIKGNFLRFYFPLWAAIPKYERFFYIPEFSFGLNL